MGTYDVAIGIRKATLDQGTGQLYADPQAKAKLFKGTQEGDAGPLHFVANWEIQSAPTFTLQPPTAAQWAESIDAKGKLADPAALPTENAFQLLFPAFNAKVQVGAGTVEGTAPVIVFATVTITTVGSVSTVNLKPLTVWIDKSKMSGLDKVILNTLLGVVLTKAQAILTGFKLPNLSFTSHGVTVSLTPPKSAIVADLLVVAASLESKATVDLSGVTWPTDPLFVLASQDVLTKVAQDLITASGLVGKEFSDNGNVQHLISWSYDAKVNNVTPKFNPAEMTTITVAVDFGFSATAKPLGIGGPCAATAATGNM